LDAKAPIIIPKQANTWLLKISLVIIANIKKMIIDAK
jgi:hypothetical protein